MELKPIKTYTKRDLFIKEVESWIFNGTVKPGQKLPSEREMSSKMNISRSVINSGLRELERLKLIKIQPQSGCIVNDYFQKGNLETLNALLNYKNGNYSPELLNSIYQARALVESEVVSLASQNCTKADAAKLNNIVDDFISGDGDVWGDKLFYFFHQLAIISRNHIYPLLICSFKPVYQILGRWNSENHGRQEIINFNKELVAAVAAHQSSQAIKCYHELVNWSLKDLLS